MRAIDVHVHPMNQAYVTASLPFIPAALKHDMQRRLQDKVLFGSDYPGWSPGQCCDEWEMEGFRLGIVEKLFHQNATRILKLEDAVATATATGP